VRRKPSKQSVGRTLLYFRHASLSKGKRLLAVARIRGTDPRRTPGWHEAGEESHDSEKDRDAHEGTGVRGLDLEQQLPEQPRECESTRDTRSKPEPHERKPVAEDHPDESSPRGAECHPYAHFVRALAHMESEDPVESHQREQECYEENSPSEAVITRCSAIASSRIASIVAGSASGMFASLPRRRFRIGAVNAAGSPCVRTARRIMVIGTCAKAKYIVW